ncbi:hypothetical protein NBRC116592_12910 [Colwellia sp. KU-HH00111]
MFITLLILNVFIFFLCFFCIHKAFLKWEYFEDGLNRMAYYFCILAVFLNLLLAIYLGVKHGTT